MIGRIYLSAVDYWFNGFFFVFFVFFVVILHFKTTKHTKHTNEPQITAAISAALHDLNLLRDTIIFRLL